MKETPHLADLRRSYEAPSLSEGAVAKDPLAQFQSWLNDAVHQQLPEPNAMTLATVDSDGAPAARTVLLKGLDGRGFMFASNYNSAKGHQIEGNPAVALVFLWHELSRQVCIRGQVSKAPAEESDAYFAARPREHQLGAWASNQSDVVVDKLEISNRYAALEKEFPVGTAIARPPHWGCYIVMPSSVEFWQGQPSRLHDRLRFTRVNPGGLGDAQAWRIERLAP